MESTTDARSRRFAHLGPLWLRIRHPNAFAVRSASEVSVGVQDFVDENDAAMVEDGVDDVEVVYHYLKQMNCQQKIGHNDDRYTNNF